MAEKATSFVIEFENEDDIPSEPGKDPKTSMEELQPTLVGVLREKYCTDFDGHRFGYFGGKPPKRRTNSEGDAELGYLMTVCLSNSSIKSSGLQEQSFASLCPNVVDLDISGNLLDSWSEILPLIQQLKNLKFLNMARNMISKNKEALYGWTDTLPNVENLVLNETGAKWKEILHIAKLLPHLKELHVCGNNFKEIPVGRHPGLHSVECLRMNNNHIMSWDEVWKLRYLPNLKSLVLSGNPLMDIHYYGDDLKMDCKCSCRTGSHSHDNTVAISNHTGDTTGVLHDNNVAITDQVNDLHDKTVTVGEHVDDTENNVNNTKKKYVEETPNNLHDNSVTISNNCDESAPSIQDNGFAISNSIDESFQDEVRLYCENILNSVIDDVIKNDIVKMEEMSVGVEKDKKAESSEKNQSLVSGEDFQSQSDSDNIGSIQEQLDSVPVENDIFEQDYIKQLSREIVEMILSRALEYVTDGVKSKHASNTDGVKSQPASNTARVNSESAPNADGVNSEPASSKSADFTKENTQTNSRCSTENTDNIKKGETAKDAEEFLKAENSCCLCDETASKQQAFNSLESLCISETKVGKWKHLSALRVFPALKSVRIKNIKLGSKLDDEDRRKLFIASLPNVKILNGSEVPCSEREKSERFLLRHFSEKKQKPDIYHVLEKRHGKLAPLVDIDISRGYKDFVTLNFVYQGEIAFTETVCVREQFGTLRNLIATKVKRSAKYAILYHKHCNIGHEETIGELQEIRSDLLPMSRLDILDGDEIHINDSTAIANATVNFYLKGTDRTKTSQ